MAAQQDNGTQLAQVYEQMNQTENQNQTQTQMKKISEEVVAKVQEKKAAVPVIVVPSEQKVEAK